MNYKEKNQLADKLCGIGLMLIFAEICISIVQTMCLNFMFKEATMKAIIYGSGALLLAVAIFLYIKAYKKSDSPKAVLATEFAVLAFTLPFIFYIRAYSKGLLNTLFGKSIEYVWVVFLAYYVIKMICVTVKAFNKNKTKKRKK